jgi:hypothetical protein
VRRVIPRDPQATVAFDALADAHLEPVEPPTAAKPGRPRAREGSGPPPTVRRIPPREPSARPEPLDVIRPMSERSPLQVWGTRAVALALVALLLLALALIVAGVL